MKNTDTKNSIKTEMEIHHAHDLLMAGLHGSIGNLWPEEQRELVSAAANVLCWILGHTDGATFAENLREAEEAARARGFTWEYKN